jgi:hypothetical protein
MQYWTFMDIIYGDKYSETIEAKSQTIMHDTPCGVIAYKSKFIKSALHINYSCVHAFFEGERFCKRRLAACDKSEFVKFALNIPVCFPALFLIEGFEDF